ncbi:MAG: zf-HC2 domain-containing protein [Agathobaculum sp.]|nr:zf-HC2 domain-containing protein [Agathobaculum sp.]
MNDEEYFEQLCSNSVDGTLTDSEREKLETHLAECPSCAALLRDLREMRTLFAQEAEAPDSLHDGIMEQLRQETKLHVVQPEKPVRRMPVFTMVGVAAAVVLVVLGGGLMPSFSTVGNGSSGASADAGDAVAAVTADSYSDGAAADIAEAAENAGVNSASRSVPETAVQGTSDIAAGGSASGETAPQTAAEEDTPSVFSLPEADSSTAAQSGGISGRAISDGDSAGIVPDEDTGALTLPEAVRGLRIAHCYIADGGELPELDGKLLYSDSSAAWFQLDNNMSTLQNTLNALEKSGCTVTAYEDIGLTLDSRADSWLLIVRN